MYEMTVQKLHLLLCLFCNFLRITILWQLYCYSRSTYLMPPVIHQTNLYLHSSNKWTSVSRQICAKQCNILQLLPKKCFQLFSCNTNRPCFYHYSFTVTNYNVVHKNMPLLFSELLRQTLADFTNYQHATSRKNLLQTTLVLATSL